MFFVQSRVAQPHTGNSERYPVLQMPWDVAFWGLMMLKNFLSHFCTILGILGQPRT